MGNGECVVVVVMSCVRGRRQSSMGYRERCVERCGRKQPLSDNIIEARDVTNMPFESESYPSLFLGSPTTMAAPVVDPYKELPLIKVGQPMPYD